MIAQQEMATEITQDYVIVVPQEASGYLMPRPRKDSG